MVEAAVLDRPAGRAADDTALPLLRLMVLADKPKGVSPGQRFRLEQWGELTAARHRIELDFFPFESPALTEILYKPGMRAKKARHLIADFLRRSAVVRRARDYDGIVIYRRAALLGPALYERMLAATGLPLFFDFDDTIWQESANADSVNGIFARLKFQGKTATICRLAAAVLPGNEFLAGYARRHNDNVHILPTSIDLAKYDVQPEPKADDPFVVCWTGSHTTLVNFETARTALERLAQRRRLLVKVICNEPPRAPIAGAETAYIPWREEGEAEAIGASHVGIMPLPDEPLARGKCGLKALQYMAVGRPAVVSPVGMNVDLVRHGENGFLASSDDEWVEILDRLAGSRELRERIGMAGRRTVEDGYSAEVVAARFARIIRSTVEARRKPS
ncbi:MAG TPA: glycosyltransferase family 4 protein [Allosphingosinicella sp.]|jgi:glycosyltransferase involved in cell wall biosynthesis